MSISTITVGGQSASLVALPSAPGLRSIQWNYLDSVARVRSAFTGQSQRQQWPGADLLAGTAELPPLTVAQADDWEAFLMQLRGGALAFQMADPLRPKVRGSGAGSPMVDNTQTGGNAAGSQTLATKGWLGNSVVLRRGDWIQVEYRLYRVLDDVTSDANGNALIPIFPSLREQPTTTGTSARWLNASGTFSKTSSSTLGDITYGAIWSNFQLPQSTPLPADAVIQGIYPVMIASSHFQICTQNLRYGVGVVPAGLGGGLFGGSGFTQPNPPSTSPNYTAPLQPAQSFASTEFYAPSIGASLGALSGQTMGASISSTLTQGPITDTMNVTGLGYAIYYTSANPTTDPLMSPPFTVPAGQGLAWALPSGVSIIEQDNLQGSATASPATDNGGLVLNGAAGLFCMAQNKRGSSADISRLSRLSFPFEEYR